MPTRKTTLLSPKKARKYSDLLRLNRTDADTDRSWFHLSHTGEVLIVNQRNGQTSTGNVRLARSEFERFMRFYERGQKLRSRE